MASNGKPGGIALVAMAFMACIVWWAARAQVAPAGKVPATRDPGYQFEQAKQRKDTMDCMAFLGRCEERAKTCETQRAQCESREAMLREELNAANAELADLRPKAALPVCSDRKDWIHAVLPTVHCYPYACGDTPFSCTQQCNSQLDCAPGRSCSAQGLCLAPP
jgi:hypothetical protein